MKVLIVDNKNENIDFLTFLLRRNKFEVSFTFNGKEAIKELKSKHFDLIISDVLMPVMDGFQLCYECKNNERFKRIPFVFYTATFISEEDEAFAMALGAEAYIKKTTDSIQFLKTIKEVVQNLKPYNQLSEKFSVTDKTVYLKLYNERLINKLEKKALDLEILTTDYHNLFNNVNDMIFSLDETGHFLEVSKRCEAFGYIPEDLIGINITSIIVTKDKSLLSKHIEQTKKLKLNSQENFEFELIRKDNKKAIVELSLSTVYEDKDFVGIYGIIRNITARRRSEEAKAQLDAFNQALIKSIPFGMSIVDEKGNLLFMNEILSKLYGKSAIGTKCWDLHIGDNKQCKNCPLNSNLKIGETEVIESHEIIEGKVFLISYTAMMFNGKKALMGVFQDITSKKQMELRQEILHNITNAVLITDNLKELLQYIFSELGKIMKTNNFYIALYNENTKMLEVPYSNDKIDLDLNCFSPEKTLTGYVLKTQKSLYADKKVFQELEKKGEVEHIRTASN
ncbi:MAG: PAS domain S-box protein, partial [Bacteroidota bacterium]